MVSSNGGSPQNQHTVQRAYLKRFANSQGWLWQREVPSGRISKVAASKATVEPGFYTLTLPDGQESETWEYVNGLVEDKASRGFPKLLEQSGSEVPAGVRESLSLWIALQAMRTSRMREVMADVLLDPDAPIPSDTPLTPATAHILALQNALGPISREIYSRAWGLARFDQPMLLTSDNPVANWNSGPPDSPDPARPIFVVPLSPSAGIVIGSRGAADYELPGDASTAHLMNQLVVNGAHRFLFHNGDDHAKRFSLIQRH